jgi:hypothetical protein
MTETEIRRDQLLKTAAFIEKLSDDLLTFYGGQDPGHPKGHIGATRSAYRGLADLLRAQAERMT